MLCRYIVKTNGKTHTGIEPDMDIKNMSTDQLRRHYTLIEDELMLREKAEFASSAKSEIAELAKQGNVYFDVGTGYRHKGYKSAVYFVIHPHMYDYIKIGFTRKSVTNRLTALSKTWQADREKLHVEALIKCENPRAIEKNIHKLLNRFRINRYEEYFERQPVIEFIEWVRGEVS